MGIYLLTPETRPALGPTQPPIQWVPGASSLGDKACGAWSWPLTFIQCRGYERVELYIHPPIRFHGVVQDTRTTLLYLYFYPTTDNFTWWILKTALFYVRNKQDIKIFLWQIIKVSKDNRQFAVSMGDIYIGLTRIVDNTHIRQPVTGLKLSGWEVIGYVIRRAYGNKTCQSVVVYEDFKMCTGIQQ